MSTPPLYYIYTTILLRVFFRQKAWRKNPPTTTTTTTKTIQLRSSNRLIYEKYFFLQVLCKDNPFTPSLKLQVPINIPPNIVCLFLFASASTYKSGTDTTLLYLQWWTKVWYVLYYYYYLCYILLLFFVFLPKSYCFFVAIKQHPHLLQTYND